MAKNTRDAEIDDPHSEIEGYLASEAWETRLAEARARRESILAQRHATGEDAERPSIRPTDPAIKAWQDSAEAQPQGADAAEAPPPARRPRRLLGAVLFVGSAGLVAVLVGLGIVPMRWPGGNPPWAAPPIAPEVTSVAPAFPETSAIGPSIPPPERPAPAPAALPDAPSGPAEAAPPASASRLGPPPPPPDRSAMSPPESPLVPAMPDALPDIASSSPADPEETRPQPGRPERPAAAPTAEPDAPALPGPGGLPGATSFRLTLHGRPSEARGTIEAQLVEAGFPAIELSETPFSWPETTVFYFHEDDAPMANRLADLLQGTSRGVIGLNPSPAVGRLDIFLGD